jgi:MoaA/NifB/PqqE/SkfB family radical SAM enzyme
MQNSFKGLFDTHVMATYKRAAKLLTEFPKSAVAMLTVAAHETRAGKTRDRLLTEGICVPPLLIVSTTEQCNLHCKDCYASNLSREPEVQLTGERVNDILNEASEAGCSTIMLAGGEPLLASGWIFTAAAHKELLVLVFTNGTLFTEGWYKFFDTHRNLIPIISVEGSPERTDDRRGGGVTEKIIGAMEKLRQWEIPFGISVTTGGHNLDEVTSDSFPAPYITLGCRLVIHVEYVPMGTAQEFTPLSAAEKEALAVYCDTRNDGAIYIAFPGNEGVYGGCLAAGRGFLHITASGSLEPCPFAPYSDVNLADMSFKEALRSPLLEAIRAEAPNLREGLGGCSLRSREALLTR